MNTTTNPMSATTTGDGRLGTDRPPLIDGIARAWWVLLLYGVVAILFGLMAIASPVSAAAALAWSLGVMALVEGVVNIVALFDRRTTSRGWLAFYAITSILFGGLAIANPLAMASALLLFLAAWLVVGGIYRILFAIRVRKVIEGEWLLIVSGLLAIVLGLLFAANPLTGIVVTTLWFGVGALFYGAFQVFVALRLRKLRT